MTDYSYTQNESDKSLSKRIGAYIKHHRLLQNKSQTDLATAAGISRSTLSLLEKGENITFSTLLQVLRILELLHVLDVFFVRNEISPIDYAKMQKAQRQRARSKNQGESDNYVSEW